MKLNDQLLNGFDAPLQHDSDVCLLNLLNGRQCNIIITMTTLNTWDLLEKPAFHLVVLLLCAFKCCWVRPCRGWSVSVFEHPSVLLCFTSLHLAVIFISLHLCTGSFIVKRSPRRQEPSVSPLCHFTVYASRRLYAIELSPHAMSVTIMYDHHADHTDHKWWLCPN